MFKYYWIIVTTLVTNLSIAEDIYQYVDHNNQLVISNKPKRNAIKVDLPPLNIYAAPMTQADFIAKNYINSQNTTVKSSSKSMARKYEAQPPLRQMILQEELEREKALLTNSQLLLIQANALIAKQKNSKQQKLLATEQIKSLADAIKEHERNIRILTVQLGK